MLKPAMLYKEELEKKFAEILYTERFFFLNGYRYGNDIPLIKPENDNFQWAIVFDKDGKEEVKGFLEYHIDAFNDCVHHICLVSFEQGNARVVAEACRKMKEVYESHHKIMWCGIAGNHANRFYQRICRKHGGSWFVRRDDTRDYSTGKRTDSYLYEIINSKIP